MPPASPIPTNCARFRPTPLEALLRREAAFAQPFHPHTLVSHSTAVSHRRLLQWKENSSAPAHHSYRLPTAAQLLEKFRDQIASHRRAVSRRGSNVINRLDRGACHFSGPLHEFWLARVSPRAPFHLRQPKRNRRDAAEGNANIVNHTSSHAA